MKENAQVYDTAYIYKRNNEVKTQLLGLSNTQLHLLNYFQQFEPGVWFQESDVMEIGLYERMLHLKKADFNALSDLGLITRRARNGITHWALTERGEVLPARAVLIPY